MKRCSRVSLAFHNALQAGACLGRKNIHSGYYTHWHITETVHVRISSQMWWMDQLLLRACCCNRATGSSWQTNQQTKNKCIIKCIKCTSCFKGMSKFVTTICNKIQKMLYASGHFVWRTSSQRKITRRPVISAKWHQVNGYLYSGMRRDGKLPKVILFHHIVSALRLLSREKPPCWDFRVAQAK